MMVSLVIMFGILLTGGSCLAAERLNVGLFLEGLFPWVSGQDQRNCLVINFGYDGELPYPQASFTTSTQINLQFGIHGNNNSPQSCSVVLVSGSALYELQAVMDKVDSLVQVILKVPYAIILLVDNRTLSFNTDRHIQTPATVQVAIENKPINPVFGFICEGDSDKSHQLLLRDGRVNKPLAEVCPSRPIRIGFNNFQDVFYVYENDTVHEYPYTWTLGKGPRDYEILKPFFHSQRLIPTWLYCDQDWGFINKSTGLPSGGTLALVANNEADLGIPSYGCFYDQYQVADCSHAYYYGNTYWFSRNPGPLPAGTNLLRIYTPICWLLIICLIFSIAIFLVVAAKVGGHYDVNNVNEDVLLVPFRLPVPAQDRSSQTFSRGSAVNFLLIIWFIFAGVLLHGFLANFRTMLLLPALEKPIDSTRDVVERGMIPMIPAMFYDNLLSESPIPEFRKLGEISDVSLVELISNNSWFEVDEQLDKKILADNSHVLISQFLMGEMSYWDYHKSEESLEGGTPWYVWMINKKWPLKEQLAKHLLRFHQMGLLFWNKQRGPPPPPPVVFAPPEKPLEKVGLKHLIMPYVILLFGLLASLAVFSYEICYTNYTTSYVGKRENLAEEKCTVDNTDVDTDDDTDDDTNDDMDDIGIEVLN